MTLSDEDAKALGSLAYELARPNVQPNTVGAVLDAIRPFLTTPQYAFLLRKLKEIVG